MKEIKEVKTNLQFFKFTGLLTDIPYWFWEMGYMISRNCIENLNWEIWLRDEFIADVEFGDYILYSSFGDNLGVYVDDELREKFEVIE